MDHIPGSPGILPFFISLRIFSLRFSIWRAPMRPMSVPLSSFICFRMSLKDLRSSFTSLSEVPLPRAFEDACLVEALRLTGGRHAEAARALGIDPRRLKARHDREAGVRRRRSGPRRKGAQEASQPPEGTRVIGRVEVARSEPTRDGRLAEGEPGPLVPLHPGGRRTTWRTRDDPS